MKSSTSLNLIESWFFGDATEFHIVKMQNDNNVKTRILTFTEKSQINLRCV